MRENDQFMDPADEEDPNRIELLYSQTDDEGEDAAKLDEEKEKKAEARRKAEKPEEYSCAACTMINPINLVNCDICGSERPPMEQIVNASIAAFEESQGGAADDGGAGGDTERTPLHTTRLQMLARDIRHVISHDQRLQILKKAQEEKERKDKEEAERKKKEEEEKAKAELDRIAKAAEEEEKKAQEAKDNEAKKDGEKPKDGKKPKDNDKPKDGDKPKDADKSKGDKKPKGGDKPKDGTDVIELEAAILLSSIQEEIEEEKLKSMVELTDNTKIGEKAWKDLKPEAMEDGYKEKDFYKALDEGQKQLLDALRTAQMN